ncbi:hypothetical protein RB597_001900 [Gaeumannomyces tritici]
MTLSLRANFALVLGLSLLCSLVSAYEYPREQFDRFLPEWNGIIQEILRSNCSEELAAYRTRENDANPPGLLYDPTRRVIECVMGHMEEFRKLDMAISAVLLGLTPTILQSLACSTLDLAFLSLRRPVLALMLAVGSPIVSPTRAMAFQRGVEEVVAKGAAAAAAPPNAPHHHPRPLPRGWWLVALAQYAAAGGCVANMANLSYELGVHAMTVISPRFTHQVALWGALVALVHVGASVGLRLRVRVEGRAPPDRVAGLPRALAALPGWMRDEVVPSAYNSTMSFSNLHDGLWFSLLSWAASAANVAITLYSTVVLSGLLFFSIRDSLTIVARYMVSVIVCRAVFALERIGMGLFPE